MTIPMPEPVAFLVDWPNDPYLGHYFAEEQDPTGRNRPLITTTQAEAYADARVRQALEWAAQACEARLGQHDEGMSADDVAECDEEARQCAAAVRNLKIFIENRKGQQHVHRE